MVIRPAFSRVKKEETFMGLGQWEHAKGLQWINTICIHPPYNIFSTHYAQFFLSGNTSKASLSHKIIYLWLCKVFNRTVKCKFIFLWRSETTCSQMTDLLQFSLQTAVLCRSISFKVVRSIRETSSDGPQNHILGGLINGSDGCEGV